MKPIPASTIDKVRQRMNKLNGRTGANLARKLMGEQPSIASFLVGVDDDIFNEDERAHLFYMGLFVWQAMKESGKLPEPDFDTIRQAELANIKAMEQAADSPDADERDVAADLLLNYPQPDLLGAVVMSMVQPGQKSDEQWAVREEAMGVMLLDLKTVIDVLDAGSSSAAAPLKGRKTTKRK